MLPAVPEVLSHCNAAIWSYELKRSRFAGGGGYHYAELHGPVFCKCVHNPCHGRTLLADGDIDTDAVLTLLVYYGVKCNGGLSGLPVTDDKFPLAASDRDHPVDGLDAGLQGLVN